MCLRTYVPPKPEGIAQANVSGIEMNQTGSNSGISGENSTANPLEIMAAGVVEVGGELELTIYNRGLPL
ncbi:hypothetical protein [Methanosarcina acetivorans]|uniref:hypothetical protein n=1 Tax=Methanosarcina acetivorans TaxID=2214 RepID=UPI0012FED46C|nr:hypothetical protein [Methanosarcina acetivorans]